MNDKLKILITSVGSLVGQNILDALEYEQFYRRDKVTVIGTNSLAECANNFRCDFCYLVPKTDSEDFKPIMKEIMLETKPDLILNGRDEDTEAMWSLKESNPELVGVLPYGNLRTILFGLDKWQTWLFTQQHGLPFAETLIIGKSNGKADLETFINKVKFPMIAKPNRGYASKGVFYVRDWKDVEIAAGFENYIFQECLGNPETLADYFTKMDGLTPLFAHTPNVLIHSGHTVISPSGEISPVFISENTHESGKTIVFRKVVNQGLEKIMTDYAKAYHAEGGVGPFGIQFQQDRQGNWKGQEINLRTNGNTFARLLLGHDDLGLIIKHFLPGHDFPIYTPGKDFHNDIVYKTLFSHHLTSASIAGVKENKKWPN
jgi:hypothetical protein